MEGEEMAQRLRKWFQENVFPLEDAEEARKVDDIKVFENVSKGSRMSSIWYFVIQHLHEPQIRSHILQNVLLAKLMEGKGAPGAVLVSQLLLKQTRLLQLVEEKKRTIMLLTQELDSFHHQIFASSRSSKEKGELMRMQGVQQTLWKAHLQQVETMKQLIILYQDRINQIASHSSPLQASSSTSSSLSQRIDEVQETIHQKEKEGKGLIEEELMNRNKKVSFDTEGLDQRIQGMFNRIVDDKMIKEKVLDKDDFKQLNAPVKLDMIIEDCKNDVSKIKQSSTEITNTLHTNPNPSQLQTQQTHDLSAVLHSCRLRHINASLSIQKTLSEAKTKHRSFSDLNQAVPVTSLTKDPLDPSLVSLIEEHQKLEQQVAGNTAVLELIKTKNQRSTEERDEKLKQFRELYAKRSQIRLHDTVRELRKLEIQTLYDQNVHERVRLLEQQVHLQQFVMKKLMPLRDQTRGLRESMERSVSREIQGFLACDLRLVLGGSSVISEMSKSLENQSHLIKRIYSTLQVFPTKAPEFISKRFILDFLNKLDRTLEDQNQLIEIINLPNESPTVKTLLDANHSQMIEETVEVIKQKYMQENIGLLNQTIQQTQKMIGECDFVTKLVDEWWNQPARLVDQDTLVQGKDIVHFISEVRELIFLRKKGQDKALSHL